MAANRRVCRLFAGKPSGAGLLWNGLCEITRSGSDKSGAGIADIDREAETKCRETNPSRADEIGK
jgi:hypothetical protein